MTYYLYKRPDGLPEVTTMPLIPEIYPGYVLVRESEDPIQTYDKVLDSNHELVDRPKQYVELRKMAYPSVGDQLDLLWHAMDDGVMPKVEPFYSNIKAVKEQYPKP